MSTLAFRRDNLLVDVNGDPDWAASYTVRAYRPGGICRAAASGTTINVHSGHGLSTSDIIIVGIDTVKVRIVDTVASTSVTVLGGAVSTSVGDIIFNLENDSGFGGPPVYDGSTKPIYVGSSTINAAISGSVVTADTQGNYQYWHDGSETWELIRNTVGTPVRLHITAPTAGSSVQQDVRYAHLFADGGDGSSASPWTTTGSNPVQAAYNDLPVVGVGGGGIVRMIPGVYSLGSGTSGLLIDASAAILTGITIEGYSEGYFSGQDTAPTQLSQSAVVLRYSGTGAAIKIGDFTGTKTAEFIKFRKFKLVQTGTEGTGVGIDANGFRKSSIEDLQISDFQYGVRTGRISDFNTWRRCHVHVPNAAGALYGMYLGFDYGIASVGQCNANLITECEIDSLRDSAGSHQATSCYGIYIANSSQANRIVSCRLHNYDKNSSFAAVSINDCLSATVRDNYMEGLFYGIRFISNDTANHYSFTVADNYITQVEGTGLDINHGSTGQTTGIVVSGNLFYNPNVSAPYATSTGIQYSAGSRDLGLVNNQIINFNTNYSLSGGTYTAIGGFRVQATAAGGNTATYGIFNTASSQDTATLMTTYEGIRNVTNVSVGTALTSLNGLDNIATLTGAFGVSALGYGIKNSITASTVASGLITVDGVRNDVAVSSGAQISAVSGIENIPIVSGTITPSNIYGIQTIATLSTSAGTVPSLYGSYIEVDHSGAGTVTNLYGSFLKFLNTAGTLTTAYGERILLAQATAGTVTQGYGLYIDTPTFSAGTWTAQTQIRVDMPTSQFGSGNTFYGLQIDYPTTQTGNTIPHYQMKMVPLDIGATAPAGYLPTASAANVGSMMMIISSATSYAVSSGLWICKRTGAGTYGWVNSTPT